MTFNNRMNESVFAVEDSASDTVHTGEGRLRGVYMNFAATEGTVIFRDGGASGTIICQFTTPAASTELDGIYIPIPGGGIEYSTDLYVAITTTLEVTTFYAQGI